MTHLVMADLLLLTNADRLTLGMTGPYLRVLATTLAQLELSGVESSKCQYPTRRRVAEEIIVAERALLRRCLGSDSRLYIGARDLTL